MTLLLDTGSLSSLDFRNFLRIRELELASTGRGEAWGIA